MNVNLIGLTVDVSCVLYICFAVATDTFFGLLRAIKYHKWNSSFGIDGAIRKVSMIACITFLSVVDAACNFNAINLLPEQIVTYLKTIGIASIGFAGFFGILLVAYEVVSILKNMYMCGLPVKWVWEKVYKFLNKYTDELPDTDDMEHLELNKEN